MKLRVSIETQKDETASSIREKLKEEIGEVFLNNFFLNPRSNLAGDGEIISFELLAILPSDWQDLKDVVCSLGDVSTQARVVMENLEK